MMSSPANRSLYSQLELLSRGQPLLSTYDIAAEAPLNMENPGKLVHMVEYIVAKLIHLQWPRSER